MPRKRKEAVDAESVTAPTQETSVPVAEIVEGVASEGLPIGLPVQAASQEVAAPQDGNNTVAFPDPMTEQVINLTDKADGPKIRLQRSNRYRQMRIVTDEKPDAKYLQMFRDAGMKWRSQEKAWSIQLDRDAAWRTALDIERLFLDVANGIREEHGLPAVKALGR